MVELCMPGGSKIKGRFWMETFNELTKLTELKDLVELLCSA